MIKQKTRVHADRLEQILLAIPPQGWQQLLLCACPSLPREGGLQKARADLKLPHRFACQCNPSCSFPGCHEELLINTSLFIIIKPRSCAFGGHPSQAPCHPGQQPDAGSSLSGDVFEQPSPAQEPLSLHLIHATTSPPDFPLG